jgi:hypothetical protein
MLRRVLLLTFALCALAAATALGQTREVTASTLTVGASLTGPTDSSLKLEDLATTGGTQVLFIDTTTLGVRRRVIAKSDLPTTVGYLDEPESVLASWAFTAGLTGTTGSFSSTLGVTGLATLTGGFTAGAASTVNANLTVGGSNDLIVGTGGIRAGSGDVLIRNVADSTTSAAIGDSAIALNRNTAVTGTFSVSSTSTLTGLATLTGGFTAGAASTVNANLTVGGSNDLIIGTGGIRAGSGDVLIRNVADSSTSAAIGDSAIALNRNTSVTGTFSVSSTSTLTGDVTAVADLAVNGGDLTSTAATLNINSGGIINMQDRLTMGSANSAGADNWASWTTGWNCSYAGSCDMRHLQADELHVRLFIAELQEAHNGAELWVKSTAILDQAFACPASGGTVSIRVRDFPSAANMRVFSTGDYVLFRPMSRTDADTDGATDLVVSECVGTVSAYVDGSGGTEGTQQWTFTRGTIGSTGGSMTATTSIPAENLALDFGVSGGGFLEATVNDGAEGVNGPYFQSVKWTGSPAAANGTKTVTSRFGKLTGITTTADEYGFIAGIYGSTSTGQYVKASNLGVDLHGVDLTLWDGGNQAIILRRGSGSAPYFGLGSSAPTTYASGSGVWMGDDGGTYKFRAGDPAARWFSIDDTNGLEFKSGSTSWTQFNGSGLRLGVAAAGQGNILADTSGNLLLRSGTVERIRLNATNGSVTIFDDDGATARVNISATVADFGTTAAHRFSVNYADGTLRAYDSAAKQYFQLDATNGVRLGDWYTAGGAYMQAAATSLTFCRASGGCPLTFDGSTGNITSTGNLSIQGAATIGGSGSFVGGGITMDTGGIKATPAASSGSFEAGKAYRFDMTTNGVSRAALAGYQEATSTRVTLDVGGGSSSDDYVAEIGAVNAGSGGVGVGSGLVTTQGGPTLGGSVKLTATTVGQTNTLEIRSSSLLIDGVSAFSGTCTTYPTVVFGIVTSC